MKKSKNSKAKRSKNANEVFQLPSSNIEMENFVQKNKIEIFESIADRIDYAVNKNLSGVEIFQFDKSNYIVVLNKKDFKENLDNIFDYSMSIENYELCGRIHSIRKTLGQPKLSKKQKLTNLI